MTNTTTHRINEIDQLLASLKKQAESLKKEKLKLKRVVEGKPKAKLTKLIASILKKNKFYRVDGRWSDVPVYEKGTGKVLEIRQDIVHFNVGIQPEGVFDDNFDSNKAKENFNRIVSELNSLDVIDDAISQSYYSGMSSMSGLSITVNKQKLLAA